MRPLRTAYLATRRRWAIVPSTIVLLFGCATGPDAGTEGYRNVRTEDSPPSTVIDARPAALIDGRGLAWGDLKDSLSEAAGAEVLREAVLDRQLEDTYREEGLILADDAVAAEQQRLVRSLDPDPDVALRLLEELRRRQRLGPVRYRRLLRRNAQLRALVQEDVKINETAIADLFNVRHGPRRRARLITVPDLRGTDEVRRRMARGEAFNEVAAAISTDASAPRGGLLAPIAERDPSYPPALRRALFALDAPDAVSDPILLDTGYALVQLLAELPGDDTPMEEVRDDLVAAVRLNQERLLMDQLALRLLRDARVTIFDDSLNDAWVKSWTSAP